ncbi:peptidylprolyl isomerase [Altibacter sp. HG106]|uniref:peptidylprolyl isomerase n=1 Tax=Altibacter sp. HG106 TaxID=3023937 RepID=UPI00234FF126|nr:peptidylprolyl isomerase [Altibacter sp. HG106]MDC7994267.1 peptidylprolyl isomerase [Altibacter sp. HG106]
MAVLNKIRQRSVFLIIIIALALFSFVLADVIRNGGFSSNNAQTTVATVNGEDIPRQQFMEQVEAYQRSLGPNANPNQAMNTIWERELRKVLLREQYESLGLSVGQEQLDDTYRTTLGSNPTFLDETGQFNFGKVVEYEQSIQNNPQLQSNWQNFKENTRASILESSYMNLVRSGLVATQADGEKQYRFENDKINIEYVQIPYTKIADEDVTVTDKEIENYIKEHRAAYEVEPMVDIEYVAFFEDPSNDDIDASRENVRSLIGSRVEYGDTIPGFAATTDVETFVNENSDGTYVDRWFFKNDIPENIRDSIFDRPVGYVYGPYKVDYTYNLSRVMDVAQKYDSVNSKHILIRYQGSMRASSDITRSKEEAQQLADSLLSEIKKAPATFEALAADFSDDASNRDNGGELGYYGPGAMVPAYDDFIFDNEIGDVGVVETDFGYHVVKIEDQKNLQRVIKVASVSKDIEASEETINEVFSKATTLEVAAQEGDFTEAAAAQDLEVRPVNRIGKMDTNIPGVGNNRTIINWAFEDGTSVGDVKRFNIPDGYVIARLTRRNAEKGLMSVAEATATVAPILRKQKKAEMIRKDISGTTLQEIASSQGVTVKNATAVTMAAPTIAGAGTEPKVVGAAFGTEAGQTTGLIDGNTGVYKVRVLAVNKAPDLESYQSFAEQAKAKVTPQISNKVYQALKKKADIQDNRATFY